MVFRYICEKLAEGCYRLSTSGDTSAHKKVVSTLKIKEMLSKGEQITGYVK